MRGILKVAAVKAPDFGERRTLILEDIATLTGGTVVSQQKGMRLDKFNKDWFGEARTITVGKDTTTIVDGKGDVNVIEARILELKSQIDKSNSPYEVEKLQERLSKLIGGVAIINVGGGTEIEMKEKKDRLDDALQATKAALEEGILPGAGVALLQAKEAITFDKDNSDDFNKGKRIVWKACVQPFEQILGNAGESGNVVTWDVSTYYNQPAAYATFFNQLKETIENWSITYGVTNDVTLFVHSGTKGFGFLQEVLKDNVDQSGGAGMVFVKNYKGRTDDGDNAMELTRNIMRYKFASFTLVLLKCSVFDDIGVHSTFQSGVSTLAPPLESFRMLIAPDSDCEGYPLIQLFFRGGCGLDDVWSSSYTPGTIDPTNGYKTTKGKISVSDYSGYDVKKEVEYNLVVRDPSKILNFAPYQS